MQGVLHFWRVIGHLLGIQDEFNLCAASTTKEIESRCAAILKHEVGPCVREAIECKDRSHLTETTGEVQTAVAMGHGIQCAITGIIKFLYPNTQKKFLLHAFGLETLSDHLNLTGREQFVFNLMRLTLSELIRIGPIRSALNGLLKLSLDRSQRMPEKRLNRIDAKYSQDPLLTCLKADKNLANLPGL